MWAARQSSNAKGVWKVVNDVRGGKQKCSLESLVRQQGSVESLIRCIEHRLHESIQPLADSCSDFVMDDNDKSDWDICITDGQVLHALRKVKTNKSQGSDGIRPIFLKLGASPLSGPLVFLFNKCLREREFPRCWKYADVCPIPKTNPASCEEMQPISLLPIVSKIFERLVLNNMKQILVQSFGPEQFAYTPHGSTTNALVAAHDTVTKNA